MNCVFGPPTASPCGGSGVLWVSCRDQPVRYDVQCDVVTKRQPLCVLMVLCCCTECVLCLLCGCVLFFVCVCLKPFFESLFFNHFFSITFSNHFFSITFFPNHFFQSFFYRVSVFFEVDKMISTTFVLFSKSKK